MSDHGLTVAALVLVLGFVWDDLVDFVVVALVEVVLVVVVVDVAVGTDLVALVDVVLLVNEISLLATSFCIDLVVPVDVVDFFDVVVHLLGWVPVDMDNAVVA